jgi:hypothetical protein
MAGTVSEIKFDSIDVSSFEVSPGSASSPTVIVFVGKGHPRPVAISLSADALFGIASAAFGACEIVDRPRVAAVMSKISAAYAASPPDRSLAAGGVRPAAGAAGAEGAAEFGDEFAPLLDGIGRLQELCRARGISDAMSASLVEFVLQTHDFGSPTSGAPATPGKIGGSVKDRDASDLEEDAEE